MIEIYTDGSVSRNGDPSSDGSYAFIVLENGVEIYSESFYETSNATNNRMEMMGLLLALRWLYKNKKTEATIHTDSEIVYKCYNKIYKQKANVDIWKRINLARDTYLPRVKVQWVKGHSTNIWNQKVDKLCSEKRILKK